MQMLLLVLSSLAFTSYGRAVEFAGEEMQTSSHEEHRRIAPNSLEALALLLQASGSAAAFSHSGASGPRAVSNRGRLGANSALMSSSEESTLMRRGDFLRAASALALSLLSPASPAFADGTTKNFKLPAIDTKKPKDQRCKWQSSAMGQANAARDELFDLRECDMSGTSAEGFDLSGVIMAKGNFAKVNFKEAQLSKTYAEGAIFDGADFSFSILDRGFYKDASFKGAIMKNAVLAGSSFEGADLTDTDWSESQLGGYELKALCKNKMLKGTNPKTGADSYTSAGCR